MMHSNTVIETKATCFQKHIQGEYCSSTDKKCKELPHVENVLLNVTVCNLLIQDYTVPYLKTKKRFHTL